MSKRKSATAKTVGDKPGCASVNGSTALTPENKLLLLKEPVRRTIVTLRTMSDQCECVDDDTSCALSNMALWLESVLEGKPSYCSPHHISQARRWDKKHKR
jgi:hypothetical protein